MNKCWRIGNLVLLDFLLVLLLLPSTSAFLSLPSDLNSTSISNLNAHDLINANIGGIGRIISIRQGVIAILVSSFFTLSGCQQSGLTDQSKIIVCLFEFYI